MMRKTLITELIAFMCLSQWNTTGILQAEPQNLAPSALFQDEMSTRDVESILQSKLPIDRVLNVEEEERMEGFNAENGNRFNQFKNLDEALPRRKYPQFYRELAKTLKRYKIKSSDIIRVVYKKGLRGAAFVDSQVLISENAINAFEKAHSIHGFESDIAKGAIFWLVYFLIAQALISEVHADVGEGQYSEMVENVAVMTGALNGYRLLKNRTKKTYIGAFLKVYAEALLGNHGANSYDLLFKKFKKTLKKRNLTDQEVRAALQENYDLPANERTVGEHYSSGVFDARQNRSFKNLPTDGTYNKCLIYAVIGAMKNGRVGLDPKERNVVIAEMQNYLRAMYKKYRINNNENIFPECFWFMMNEFLTEKGQKELPNNLGYLLKHAGSSSSEIFFEIYVSKILPHPRYRFDALGELWVLASLIQRDIQLHYSYGILGESIPILYNRNLPAFLVSQSFKRLMGNLRVAPDNKVHVAHIGGGGHFEALESQGLMPQNINVIFEKHRLTIKFDPSNIDQLRQWIHSMVTDVPVEFYSDNEILTDDKLIEKLTHNVSGDLLSITVRKNTGDFFSNELWWIKQAT